MFLIFRRELCKVLRSAKLRGDVKKRITSWRLFRMFRSRVGLWNHCLKQTRKRKSMLWLKHFLNELNYRLLNQDFTVKAENQTCSDSDSEHLQKTQCGFLLRSLLLHRKDQHKHFSGFLLLLNGGFGNDTSKWWHNCHFWVSYSFIIK